MWFRIFITRKARISVKCGEVVAEPIEALRKPLLLFLVILGHPTYPTYQPTLNLNPKPYGPNPLAPLLMAIIKPIGRSTWRFIGLTPASYLLTGLIYPQVTPMNGLTGPCSYMVDTWASK